MSKFTAPGARTLARAVKRTLSEPDVTPVALSLVVPLYRVEQYLPALLDSLSAQRRGAYRAEVIFIDDGSPDRSGELAQAWLDRLNRPDLTGRLIRQENAGVCAARNAGIDAAEGDWVSFPDSDDYLHPDYLRAVAAFLTSAKGTRPVLVAANIHKFLEDEDRVTDNHSLRFKFKGKAKNVDLVASPHYVQMSAATAFVRRSVLLDGPRFSTGLHASEDAIFVSEVLAHAAAPLVGIVPGAIYYYRKRAARDSAVDLYNARIETYFERFEVGYLPLLRRLADPDTGLVPDWLANQVLYELRWIFGKELDPLTASALSDADRRRFLDNTAEMLSHVSDQAILGYRVTSLPHPIRMLWLDLKGTPRPEPQVYVTRLDALRQELQVRYLCDAEPPVEEFRVRAQLVTPRHTKTTTISFFGRTMHERVVWLPATGWLSVRLDGQQQELGLGEPKRRPYALTEVEIGRHFDAARLGGTPISSASAVTPPSRGARRYAGAWIVIGEPQQAGTASVNFYRWLRRHQPGLKVWFAISRRSSDWARLKAARVRLLDLDAPEFTQALSMADTVLFSGQQLLVLDLVRDAVKAGPALRAGYLPEPGGPALGAADAVRIGLHLWCAPDAEAAAALSADGTGSILTSREVVVTGPVTQDSGAEAAYAALTTLREPIARV